MSAAPRIVRPDSTQLGFRLRTLGSPLLERENEDGSWSAVQRTGKALALLIFLAVREGKRVSREQLSDLLWGDESPERSRATLRQTLYTVRGLIGEDAIDATRDEVGLVAGRVRLDRDAFLAAARDGDDEQMLALYAGPFCDKLDVGGADAFERWALAERDRLRALLIEAVSKRVTQAIADGESRPALEIARRLAAVEPGQERVVVLLFDALVAAGELSEARERLDELTVQLSAQDYSVPPDVAERLARLKRLSATQGAPLPAQGTLAALGQTLVGRDAVLDALIREAERARKDARPRRVVLVGPAGVGKSRVYDEFDARMRLRGARVVRVRLLPGMRDVPYSAFADTVRALAALPAAMGVSERTAHVLVGLIPELSSRFPAARGAVLPEEGRALALRDAGADLFASVAEQRLVVHLVDDLHYADEESLALFMAVRLETERRTGETMRLLTVRSFRRLESKHTHVTDAVIEVGPLGPADIRRMMADVVPFPDAAWCDALVARLHELSRGMPQFVMQMIRSAVGAGLLSIADGTWGTDRPAQLLDALSRFAGLQPTLIGLSPTARRVLSVLTTWSRPIDERDLASICAQATPPIEDPAWRHALREMEEMGLVQSRENAWAVAHDSVVEAFMRDAQRAREEGPEDYFGLLLDYFGDPERLSVVALEHFALLAGQRGDAIAAVRLARRAVGARAMREAGLVGRRLARAIADAAGHPEWERRIYRSLGFFVRQAERTRVAMTAVVTVAAVAILWLGVMLRPRLVLEVEPMAELSHAPNPPGEVIVQPRLFVMNGFGTRLTIGGDVRVRASAGWVGGDTVLTLDSGRVQFRRLQYLAPDTMPPEGYVNLLFDGPWYVRGTQGRLNGVVAKDVSDNLSVRDIAVNGVPVDESRIVTIAAGTDSLHVEMTFEYTTKETTANYIVGAARTWGERKEGVVRVAGLPRPVLNGWRSARFSMPAPDGPGPHHVLVVLGLEDTAEHLFAGTSWTEGLPRWNDGDDLHDLGVEAFERLRVSGEITSPEKWYRGTALLVRVQEPR